MLQVSHVTRTNKSLGDAKSDAITLQLAANRYATAVGKTALTTDGIIGNLTLAMVRAALQYLVTQNVSAATANGLLTKVTTVSQLTTSAVGMSTFLNDSMDTIKLAAIANKETSTPASTSVTPTVATMFVPYVPVKIPSAPSAPTAPPAKPLVSNASSQQITPTVPQNAMILPTTAVVGLSASGKKTLLIVGGVIAGLLILKRLL